MSSLVGSTQGNRVLTEEDFQQVVFPPAGLEPFALDAHFQAGLVFEQIVGNLPQQGHVLRRVVLAHPALVFPKGDVEGPVQRVLDTPVAAHRRQQTLGRGLQAADVVSSSQSCLKSK